MSQTVSPAEAALILKDRGSEPADTLDNPALLLALIRAFHAAGRRAIDIPADLAAVRAAARDRLNLSIAA